MRVNVSAVRDGGIGLSKRWAQILQTFSADSAVSGLKPEEESSSRMVYLRICVVIVWYLAVNLVGVCGTAQEATRLRCLACGRMGKDVGSFCRVCHPVVEER